MSIGDIWHAKRLNLAVSFEEYNKLFFSRIRKILYYGYK